MNIWNNMLSSEQLNQLNQLITNCQKKDETVPNLYPHILTASRPFPMNGLIYQNDYLIGFISCYFFYKDSCEVGLLIAPSARRKGHARNLLKRLVPIIHTQNIKNLIFSSPHQLNDEWLPSKGLHFKSSEYHMVREELHPVFITEKQLSFKKADLNHIADLCSIDEACFPKEHSEMKSRFQGLLQDRNYQLILAIYQNKIMGKAHIRWHKKKATFSDIGILPPLQGRGFGQALLAYCINYALSEGKFKLDLDVETRNINALKLYTRLGFNVSNACDYWTIAIDKIKN